MGISAGVYVKHNDKPVEHVSREESSEKSIESKTDERINFDISVSVPSDVIKDLEDSQLGLYSQSNTSFKCGNNQVSKKINRKNTVSVCTVVDNSNQTEYTDKEECQKVFKQLVKQYCELDI